MKNAAVLKWDFSGGRCLRPVNFSDLVDRRLHRFGFAPECFYLEYDRLECWANFQRHYKPLADEWIVFDNSADAPTILERHHE